MRLEISGVKVDVSYFAVFLVSFSVVSAGVGQSKVLLCILCAALHEAGHLLFICKFKGKPCRIKVNLFEIRICTDMQSLSTLKESVIIISGVACNFMLCTIAYIAHSIFPSALVYDFFLCNLVVGVINILPVESFDGGQLMFLLLCKIFSYRTAQIIILVLTLSLMFPIAVIGVFVLFSSQHNYSLLFVFIHLLSIFIIKELR